MELYLIRHGLAAERGTYAQDDDRPLTDAGRQKTAKVADRLQGLHLQFDGLFTSPLVRAHQTAEILQKAGLAATFKISPHLAPAGSLTDWIAWLTDWREQSAQKERGTLRLALVGHEPDLSEWAEQLIGGQVLGALILKKAGIIGLLLPETGSPLGHSQLFWLTSAKLLL